MLRWVNRMRVARTAPPVGPIVHPHGPDDPKWASDPAVDADLRAQWISDGFVVLRGVFAADQVARYNAAVRRGRDELETTRDAQGYGNRIAHLHQKQPELLELAASPRILSFLYWAFDDTPDLFGSLNFERGTEQEAHIDAIFFWPEPCYAMAGVWVALEDIGPESGPLFYIPGSHRWPFVHSDDVVRTRPELAAQRAAARAGALPADARRQLVGTLGLAWTEDFLMLERERGGMRVPVMLRAGDAVVWHALLAHGGSPRTDAQRSRLSVVFHYWGHRAALHDGDQFMLYGAHELPGQPSRRPALRRYGALQYMHFPHVLTYPNGQEVVHKLAY